MARSKATAKSQNGRGGRGSGKARNGNGNANGAADGPIRGAELRPVRMVRRELVSPSGSVIVVDVPVYPPFRLEGPAERSARNESAGEEGSGGAAS